MSRLLGYICTSALIGAMLVAGTSISPTSAAAAEILGPLHTNGEDDRIYDADGNQVRLVGFNWNGTENGGRADKQKIADGCGVVWRTPADALGGMSYDDAYQRIVDLGYNVLRLPISWHNLEPIAPTWNPVTAAYVHDWNQTYLDDLRSMVAKAKSAGLRVILDMHQDYWSPALHRITNWDGTTGYCEGVGMPRWMYPTADGKTTTTQNTDFYQSMNWFFRNMHDPLATTTHQTPWQLFAAAWDKLAYEFSPASGFAASDAVVGADVFNEPYWSYVGGSPAAGQSVLQAAGARLKAFYEAIGPVITARHPAWLLFFQDSTGGYNAANPGVRETPTMTAKPAVPGNWVYSAHIYAFSYGVFSDGVVRHDDFGITVANQLLANARAWGVPLYIGEFTNFSVGVDARQMTPSTMAQTRLFLDWAKTNRVSWTFWAYVNPYWPMAFQNYQTNQPIPVIRDALATGLDSTAPPPPPPPPSADTWASDAFGRSVTGGLGTADVGGVWSVIGGAASFSVSGGAARVTATAGGSRTMALDSFQSTDTKLTMRLAFDKAQTGGGSYAAVIGRRVTTANDYRLKLRVQTGGVVTAQLVRVAGGAESVVQTVATVPGLSWGPGQYVRVRFEVEGTAPTTLRAKVWADAATEPTSWILQATDATAGLQTGGGVGVWEYLSSSATNAPMTLLVDDLLAARVTGGTTPPPPVNTPPTASFTASCTDLTCAVDAAASADGDGTITSYAWTFGDGNTATGTTASRTYASPGTYTITLTVTDDDGATATATRQVAPTAPPPPPPTEALATDAFARSVSGGWGSADVGGAWTVPSAATSFSVSGGVGSVSMAAGAGRNAYLAGVSSSATDLAITMSLDKAATGGGVYVAPIVRRVAGVGEYRAKVRVLATGQVALSLVRTNASGAETTIRAEATVSGVTATAGTVLRLRVQAFGASPTTLRAKVWAAGAAEPGAWAASVTDSTAGMQGAGGIGIYTYLSGSATNAPVAVRVDDLAAQPTE